MTERLSNKNPCNDCKVDRQIGNPNRWECECNRCDKPNDWKSECVKKLAEYETAEEEGRLVWLPCKIGDVLYLPIDFQNRIYTGKCVGFEYSRMRRKWVVKVFTSEERNSYEAFEHFGKTFFLTREEAEKALEEMKNALEKHITARIKSEEMVD